jgi:hypothetical protein
VASSRLNPCHGCDLRDDPLFRQPMVDHTKPPDVNRGLVDRQHDPRMRSDTCRNLGSVTTTIGQQTLSEGQLTLGRRSNSSATSSRRCASWPTLGAGRWQRSHADPDPACGRELGSGAVVAASVEVPNLGCQRGGSWSASRRTSRWASVAAFNSLSGASSKVISVLSASGEARRISSSLRWVAA